MRALKGEERALWREAMRTVKPLRRAARMPPAPAEAVPQESAPDATPRPHPHPAARTGLDRRSAQRLRRGQMTIAARLDLHGMTQEAAHRALARFIAEGVAAGRRAVLVITGKSGVLRQAVPRWLDEGDNRAHVLAATAAQARHGGEGALYVLLRRRR